MKQLRATLRNVLAWMSHRTAARSLVPRSPRDLPLLREYSPYYLSRGRPWETSGLRDRTTSGKKSRLGRKLALAAGWVLVLGTGPGAATCPGTAPPATLPLPITADPPVEHEIRVRAFAGGGGDTEGSGFGGGGVRATFSPIAGMVLGAELGGGARHNSDKLRAELGIERETVVSSRLLVGYGFWLYRRTLSLAAEAGLTPGLHSEHGGFVGPDVTLSMTAGGQKWWALTVGYRLAYMVPSSDESWSPALYHLAALTLVVPRAARYGFFLQTGLVYGHKFPAPGNAFGLLGAVGFTFRYAP